MLELSLNQVMKLMGTNLILENVNFHVYEGDRVGIIGANGSGKSTILKLIAGIIKLKLFPGSWSPGYDYGFISRPKNARIGYLDQMPHYEKTWTVYDVLKDAFKDVIALEQEMRILEGKMATAEAVDLESMMFRYGEITHQFEAYGGYEMNEKINKVCTGMKFSKAFLNLDFSSLSGGEKTKVEMARLLILQPEILLLDEPTNHLDIEVAEWLEVYLKAYRGIVMVVSHDRHFLDVVTNKILEIEFKTTQMYTGNYSAYKYQKDELLRIQAADYKEQQKQIKSMKKQIQELRQWAMKSDNNKFFQRAASIQIKLDKMKLIPKPVFEKRNLRLDLSFEKRSGNETIVIKNVSKSYGQPLLSNASALIHYGDRVALVGRNGCGKSTLIKMLMKDVQPDSGEIRLGASVDVAYLPQHIVFDNEEVSVLTCFRDNFLIHEGPAREYLAQFMFYGKSVFTEVKGLSGGERIRLKLAILLYKEVNVLILDEPTNHLDIETIETIEAALSEYKGTILFVSHDRYFINTTAEKILAIENGQLKTYDTYSSYRHKNVVQPKKEVKSKKVRKIEPIKKKNPERFETDILMLEKELNVIEKEMISYGSDYEKLQALQQNKEALMLQLNDMYQAWEEEIEK